MSRCPEIPAALLEHLDKLFTPPAIQYSDSAEKIRWHAAQHSVIQWMRMEKERQANEGLGA